MKQLGFIYGLICPITNKIRYIGQTFHNVKRRLKRHIADTKNKKGRLTKKEAWIKSLIIKNEIHKLSIVILEICDRTILDEKEKIWIKKHENLTNLTEGGQGVVYLSGIDHPHYGKHRSEETKKKISDKNKGEKNGMYGKRNIVSTETKNKISAALQKSQKFKTSRSSVEFKEKMSKIQSTDDTKVLLMNTKTNEIYGEWINCAKLAQFLECTYANIKNARRDKRPVGKRIKKLNNIEYYVVYKKDAYNYKTPLTQSTL